MLKLFMIGNRDKFSEKKSNLKFFFDLKVIFPVLILVFMLNKEIFLGMRAFPMVVYLNWYFFLMIGQSKVKNRVNHTIT